MFCGDGALFSMLNTDLAKYVDVTWEVDVKVKSFNVQWKDAPFGANISIKAYNSNDVMTDCICNNLNMIGSGSIDAEASHSIPVNTDGKIVITVANGDTPSTFQVVANIAIEETD